MEKLRRVQKIFLYLLIIILIILGVEAFLLHQKGYSFLFFFKEPIYLITTSDRDLSITLEEHIGEEGIRKVWLAGVITSPPYLKEDNFYYTKISFREKKLGSNVELLLGESDELISCAFELDKPTSEESKKGKTWRLRPINEIIFFLKPQIFVKVEIPIDFDQDKIEKLKKDPNCDSKCLERISFIGKYLRGNKEFVQILKAGGNIDGKVIGPVLQLDTL
jgi:hypothetical protein